MVVTAPVETAAMIHPPPRKTVAMMMVMKISIISINDDGNGCHRHDYCIVKSAVRYAVKTMIITTVIMKIMKKENNNNNKIQNSLPLQQSPSSWLLCCKRQPYLPP